MPLQTACESVEVQESRRDLQQFIYDVLIDYRPSESVLKQIPYFPWRQIFTTNFDRLLERAYEEVDNPVQKLIPIYSDRDKFDIKFGVEVPYYKLHGCITKIHSDLDLVLTAKDYATFRKGRVKLFHRLQDDLMSFDKTVLFIGYSLTDSDFQNLFYEVQSDMKPEDFSRCYAVSTGQSKIIVNNWNSRKVTILDLTAEEFFEIAQDLTSDYGSSKRSCQIIPRYAEGLAGRDLEPRRSPKCAQTGQIDAFSPLALLCLPGFGAPGSTNYAAVGISGVRRMSPTVITWSVMPRAMAGVRSRYLPFKPGIGSRNDSCGRAR